MGEKLNNSELPVVSIVMPIRNEAEFIERCLRAISSQKYPLELLEVIIADGESDDETIEIVERLRDETRIPFIILNNPKRTAPCGLNLAIAKANGEIVVRVDGHCEIDEDYVANCVKHLLDGKAEGVGGPIETVGETLQAKAVAIAMSSRFGVGGSAFRTIDDQEMYVDTVAFPGYRIETLAKAGDFDEELVRNQDDEFNYRIRKMGGRILLSPEIRSLYHSRSTFRSLWRQYFQYGYWKIRVLQLHPKQMSLRQFVPFVFVLSIVVLALTGIFFRPALMVLAAVLILYTIGNLFATIQAGKRISIKGLPYVSLSFLILHVSYGTGFIFGLFAFRNRWRERGVLKNAES